jgi:predicted ABC-type ATPase
MKDIIVFGGPNGAGKTTAAFKLLPTLLETHEFVNADEIARGLSPFNPEGSAVPAGRLMLERLEQLARLGESFAFETTCSGRGHVRFLKRCRDDGYRLTLLFCWLPSSDIAIARVAQRVREGGHRIPEDVIRRRYALGLRHMRQLYLPIVHTLLVFNNSDVSGILIAERREGRPLVVHDAARWNEIEEATR